MKVRLEKDYKELYTLAELEQAKRIIEAEKEDEETPAGWAMYAAQVAARKRRDYVVRILEATAHTAKNGRVWEAFEGGGMFDIWIEYIAQTADGFIQGGAYLTDIWGISRDDDRTEHAYIRYAKFDGLK